MSRSFFDVTIAAAIAGLLVVAAPTQAQTQSNLSEKLNKLMQGAKRTDTQGSPLGDLTKPYDEVLSQEIVAAPEKRRLNFKARASVYEMAREYDRAEADLNAAMKIDPADPADFVDRGYFYLRRGRYNDALQDFAAGARADPAGARYRYGAARVQATQQNYAAAIELYDQAIRLNPRDGVTYLSRAEANLHLKKFADAKADYDRAIRVGLRRPSDKFYGYVGRGFVNLLQDNYDAAAADFGSALDVEPYAVNAWMWRGFANERRGHSDAAISDFEHAYAVEPDNPLVMANLRRLRAHEPQTGQFPDFQIDEKKRLAEDMLPSAMPKRRPAM